MRKSMIIGTILALLILLIAVPAYTETGSLTGKKICLDPGHGGSDPGAVNEEYNLQQKDINLDVAYGLKALLEGDGATVVMTRTDDSSKSNNDRYTFCNNEQATILVSVHTNSTSDPTMDGSLALYFHNDDKVLAQAIYDVMYPYLRDTAPDLSKFTDFGLDRYASGVLLKSNMPAAMMEPLFMANPAEADWLTVTIHLVDAEGVVVLDGAGNPTPNPKCTYCRRAQIAQAIHDGILAYFAAEPTPEPGGAMHVSAIDMGYDQRGPNYVVYTKVAIVDKSGAVVPGATVYVGTTPPDGTTVSDAGTTGADGTVTFSVRSRQTGTYTSEVTDVTHASLTYNPTANVKTSESLTVP